MRSTSSFCAVTEEKKLRLPNKGPTKKVLRAAEDRLAIESSLRKRKKVSIKQISKRSSLIYDRILLNFATSFLARKQLPFK
jgi:uncharacterized ubiquitin-like protein YukD